jgi:hypothetical protein
MTSDELLSPAQKDKREKAQMRSRLGFDDDEDDDDNDDGNDGSPAGLNDDEYADDEGEDEDSQGGESKLELENHSPTKSKRRMILSRMRCARLQS